MSIFNLDIKYSHGNKYDTTPYYIGEHLHPYYEIVYYIDGAGKSIINGKEYLYGNNTFAYIPKNIKHSEVALAPSSNFLIGFTFNDELLNFPQGVYSDDSNKTFYKLMMKINDEFEKSQLFHKARMDIIAEDFVIKMARTYISNKYKQSDVRLDMVLNYINSYYDSQIDIKELAKSAHYSYDRFRHLFTERTGVSPQKYISGIRLSKAKKLLEDTNLPIKVIAAETGYNTPSAFIIDFKNEFGITPFQYRKNPYYDQIATYLDKDEDKSLE